MEQLLERPRTTGIAPSTGFAAQSDGGLPADVSERIAAARNTIAGIREGVDPVRKLNEGRQQGGQ